MTTSETITAAWRALEGEAETLPGIYERRVFAHSVPWLFVGVSRPSGSLLLFLEVSASVGTDGLERETVGYRVTRQYRPAEKRTRVQLELLKLPYRQLFEVVAADIADTALKAGSEASAVASIRRRLDHWQRFMQSASPAGLSREQQIGLFGELRVLQALLEHGCPPEKGLKAWKGPDRLNQDFQFGTRVLEVKATCTNSSSRIRISNELQLDDSGLSSLHLCHLWLLEQEGAGVTLPALVSLVSAKLSPEHNAVFQDLLLAWGYHTVHEANYRDRGYSERQRSYYLVTGAFPRIGKQDLRAGVSEVAYVIDVAGFQSCETSESEVVTTLLSNPDE